MKHILIPIIAAALAVPSLAAPPQQMGAVHAEEVRIAFPGLRIRIRNFRADARAVVYLEDQRRN